jgi:hypothetical protein
MKPAPPVTRIVIRSLPGIPCLAKLNYHDATRGQRGRKGEEGQPPELTDSTEPLRRAAIGQAFLLNQMPIRQLYFGIVYVLEIIQIIIGLSTRGPRRLAGIGSHLESA